jgi:hypothetical protein
VIHTQHTIEYVVSVLQELLEEREIGIDLCIFKRDSRFRTRIHSTNHKQIYQEKKMNFDKDALTEHSYLQKVSNKQTNNKHNYCLLEVKKTCGNAK